MAGRVVIHVRRVRKHVWESRTGVNQGPLSDTEDRCGDVRKRRFTWLQRLARDDDDDDDDDVIVR